MANPTIQTDTAEAAVLLSGGMDSAACAHMLLRKGYRVRGLFIDFGQAAVAPEATAVSTLANILGIAVTTISASAPNRFGSGELVGRNAFLVMSGIFLGGAHSGLIAIGIHAGTPYYDCSPPFLSRMKQVAQEHTSGRLDVVAPLLDWHKPDIYSYFQRSGLPIEATYSCESGTIPPCGSCASCRDRRALGC
uniref:Cap9 n=1 Tax=Hyphomicrobiales TaxID=356 RepID=UPI003CDF86A5